MRMVGSPAAVVQPFFCVRLPESCDHCQKLTVRGRSFAVTKQNDCNHDDQVSLQKLQLHVLRVDEARYLRHSQGSDGRPSRLQGEVACPPCPRHHGDNCRLVLPDLVRHGTEEAVGGFLPHHAEALASVALEVADRVRMQALLEVDCAEG